jgi:polyisoprenoid-binding protein YceI
MYTRLVLLLLALFVLTSVSLYRTGNYTISDTYVIAFDGSGAEGTFRGLTGEIVFDRDNLSAARMDVSVDAATIETGNKTKDKHARGEAWFDVERYPKITYVATDFERMAEGYLANGVLTLHGVSKSKALPFTFTPDGTGGTFTGKMTVDREAFGIEGPWLAFTVGDEFEVKLRVPVE